MPPSSAPDEVVRVWEVATGSIVFTSPTLRRQAAAIAWNPTDKLLAYSWSDGSIWVWEWQAGRCQARMEVNEDVVVSLAWSPDGKHLAGACFSGKVVLWRMGR